MTAPSDGAPARPMLFTFDVFGTLVDWRSGLTADLARIGVALEGDAAFDAVIDAQAEDEQAGYRSYAEITARSLERVLGVASDAAAAIGAGIGRWPIYPDVRAGLAPGPAWWHVSAYADYDLETARALGLTTVFVARPHARAPVAGRKPDVSASDLIELAGIAERVAPATT